MTKPLPPTLEELRAFQAGAVVVRRGVFDAREVATARAAFERLYAAAQLRRVTGEHAGAYFVLDEPTAGTGEVVVRRVVWAGGAEPALLALAEDARLLVPALALLGTTSCEQLLCQAHYKMPGDGVAFAWHQDVQHRDKGGGTWCDITGRGSFVQTVLLVDDMPAGSGQLRFVPPGAYAVDAAGRLDHGAPIDDGRAVDVTGHAGDVLFFGPYAVHGSAANDSAEPRRVLINGYAAPGANRRVYPGRGAGRALPVDRG